MKWRLIIHEHFKFKRGMNWKAVGVGGKVIYKTHGVGSTHPLRAKSKKGSH